MDYHPLLKNAYDIHVHVAPDVIERAVDLPRIEASAEAAGMAGILLKDHCTSTIGRVAALNARHQGHCRFYSALALNPPVGGLNPTAAEAALRAGADVIFFPTYGAANHIRRWGAGQPPTAFPFPKGPYPGLRIVDNDDHLIPEASDILDLIKEFGAVMGTGHLAPSEGLILMHEALQRGVRRMLVTHASESVTPYDGAAMQAAANMGAMIEHSFFATTDACPDKISMSALREHIRLVGTEHTILSSDFGQVGNGDPVANFGIHLAEMLSLGFTKDEVREMVSTNPQKLLGG